MLILLVAAGSAAAWWGWRTMGPESARFTFLLMEINSEPRKILPGETVSLNPMHRVRIVEVGSTSPLGLGVKLSNRDINVNELLEREMPLVDILPDREAFDHYTFPISVLHRGRHIGGFTWDVRPSVDDWMEKANRLINKNIRIAFLERAARFTSRDPLVTRRLLDEYKKASRWRQAREMLKRMAAETPDTSLYAELLEVYEGLGDRQGMRSVLETLVEREPEVVEWRLTLAELLEEMERIDEAALHYEAALKISDERDHPALYGHLGYLYTESGRYRDAVSMYTEAARLDQKDANLHYNLAYLHDSLGQTEKAEFHLENAIILESRDMEGRLTLAERLVGRGELEKARFYLREVLHVDPDNLEALLLMARIVESESRSDELLDLYKRIHRLDPGSEAVIYNLGVLLYEMSDYREASRWLSIYADKNPGDVSVQEMLFDCYVKTGRSDEAFVAAERVSELKPGEIYPFQYMVDYLLERGRHSRVIEILEPLTENHPEAEILKTYLLSAYIRTGETGPALSVAEDLLEKKPGDEELLRFLFDGYRSLGDNDSAFRTAETLASLGLAGDSAYDFLFDRLSGEKDYERIISIMGEAVQNDPDRPRLREYLVVAYLGTGEEEKAAAQLEAIAGLRPDDMGVLLNLAKLHEKLGNYAESSDAYAEVFSLDPDNEEAAEGYLRTRLKRVGR